MTDKPAEDAPSPTKKKPSEPWTAKEWLQAGGGLLLIVAFIGSCRQVGSNDPSTEQAAQADVSTNAQCDFGSQKTGLDYVANEQAEVRTAPKDAAPVVQWRVAEESLPFSMDEGVTVREHCRSGNWSKINVQSSKEISGYYGWVPSSSLRKVKTGADGRRIYAEEDFEWPEGSAGLRTAAVTIMNRIMEQRPECTAIDEQSLVLNKVGPRKVFSVPCFTSGDMVSFDFVAADAASGRSFVKVEPMRQMDAIEACKSAVLSHALHPSTVEFPMLDYHFREMQDGQTEVAMSASAKNAFGLTLNYEVRCEFSGTTLTNFTMSETGQ